MNIMMDHDFAVKNHMIERYLLEELTDTERDAFEEHYFDCSECAEELRYGSEFIEYGQKVIQKDKLSASVRAGSWFGGKMAWPAAAVITLALAAGTYHQITSHNIDHVEKVSDLATLALTDARKGPLGAAMVISPSQTLRLRFMVPPDVKAQGFASYEAMLKTDSGKELVHKISSKELSDQVEWLLPAGSLQSGSYSVTIRAFTADGVQGHIEGKDPSFPFKLQLQGH